MTLRQSPPACQASLATDLAQSCSLTDPRRQRPISRAQGFGGIIQLLVDNVLWAEVEYSSKRQAWCIEDAEGRCLSHKAHIQGDAESMESAIAVAEAMIRDGHMPTPEEAKAARKARLERQRNTPSAKRRRAERQERIRLFRASREAEEADDDAQPLYEMIADAFDLTDPELWRSNRFAMLRPRLIVSVRRAIATLEYESLHHPDETEQRRLARAREILTLLEAAR